MTNDWIKPKLTHVPLLLREILPEELKTVSRWERERTRKETWQAPSRVERP